jgi:hypothetical protein
MFKFDTFQSYGKESFDAAVASATALSKGYQTVAQEVIDYNRRSFEKGTYALEQVAQLKTLDQVVEAQQAFAKDSYENFVSEAARINNIYVNAVKDAYRPFETTWAAFGVNVPK